MAPHDLRLARRVAAGDLRGAASLLRQGLSPDESWLRGAPCTVLAARLDHDRLLGLVLNNGEEKDLSDGDGMTALAVSASRGSTACVRLLLARRADVDCRDLSLRSPLQHAAQAGHQAAVALLIEGGANINAQDERGVSALMAACDIGHVKIVDNLLRHGAEPDLRDRQGVTALLRAAQFVHAAARKLPDLRGLGEAGGSAADDNDDDNGNDGPPTEPPSPPRLNGPFPPGTPARLLPFMPRRGAASFQPTEAGIPDDEASARASREAMVCALLAKRATTDVRVSGSGLTALMASAREGHLEVVMPLLKAGAALDLRAHGGVAERPDVGSRVPPSAMYGGPSALALAAAHGHSRIVEALLARGARSDERDAEGFTVLWQASARNHVRATHVLQERGGLKELRTWADPSERRQVARARAAAQEERWAVEAEAEAKAAAAALDKPETVGDGAYAAPPDTHDDTTQVPDTMEQGLGEGDGDGDQGSWLPTPLAVWQPSVFELDPFEEGEDPEEPDPVFVTAMDEELRTSMMRELRARLHLLDNGQLLRRVAARYGLEVSQVETVVGLLRRERPFRWPVPPHLSFGGVLPVQPAPAGRVLAVEHRGATLVQKVGAAGYAFALGTEVMRAGTHRASFQLLRVSSLAGLVLGVAKPCCSLRLCALAPVRPTDSNEGWGLVTGSGMLRHGGVDYRWAGMRDVSKRQTVELTLDCDAGTLVASVDGKVLGVLVTDAGLQVGNQEEPGVGEGGLCWMVELHSDRDAVRALAMVQQQQQSPADGAETAAPPAAAAAAPALGA